MRTLVTSNRAMTRLEEIFVLRKVEQVDVRTESTGSREKTHGVGGFDPFGSRGDVQFGPQGGRNGGAGSAI